MVQSSNGKIYGELNIPDAENPIPLVILSHGFGGNLQGNQDYAAYFFTRGFATYNFDFCGGGIGSKSEGTILDMSVLTEAREDLFRLMWRRSVRRMWLRSF